MMNGKRSSVHLRTLSRLGVDLEKDVQNLEIPSVIKGEDEETQDVTGLSGRLRLQRAPTTTISGFAPANWMDKQRQYLQAYEYLCHIGEAKEWIEGCLGCSIAPIVDLEEELRNGVVLARLAKVFMPELVPRIFEAPKLQFRHSDNINRFFKFVDRVQVPDNFRFELTDLYEKKNIPKVIYSIHALSFVLVNAGLAHRIGDLVGKLQFTEDEIRQTQKSLDATGVTLPNFKSVGSAISGEPEAVREPAESEEARVNRLLANAEHEIILFQARARGALLRQQISLELQKLEDFESKLVALQGAARGYLVRQQYYENADTYKQINEWVTGCQTASRGYLVRCKLKSRCSALNTRSAAVVVIQALSRGYLRRRRASQHFDSILTYCDTANTSLLQALMRGSLTRAKLMRTNEALRKNGQIVVQLQAIARGFSVRKKARALQLSFAKDTTAFLVLQAHARGYLVRRADKSQKHSVLSMKPVWSQIVAISQGFLMRKKIQDFGRVLELEEDMVVDVQALCMGMLIRMEYNDRLISLAHAEWAVLDTQALARGFIERKRYQARLLHYNKNMEQVIKVQSFVRARQQGAAYRSLTLDKDPPMSTIKNFIHLLNDSNFDFEEEVAMEQARKDVVRSIRQNETAEEHIEQMDIKIALLVKQAIKIDEVIQHQRRMDKGLGGFPLESSPFDLKALNKQARSQLENYQKLFYILQTQPVYLARLFSLLKMARTPEKNIKKLDSLIMVMYGYAQKKREEYFIIKLVRASVIKEISQSAGLEDFIQEHFLWSRVLGNYAKGSREQKFLEIVLSPVINIVLADDFLDLESDPLMIYHAIRQEEEMRTGQQSLKPLQISHEYAIQDPDTRVMFIKHLRDLRDLTEQTIDALESAIQCIPYGIRYITREAERAMQEHLGSTSQHNSHRVVGHIICRQFLTPALISPEYHGFTDTAIRPGPRKNLAELSKMLNQIASGRVFENGSYLQPLNEFIMKAIDRMANIFLAIIDVDDLDTHYNITELDDVIATKRPILYLKASDIFSLHSLVHQNVQEIAPELDDPLNSVLTSLGPPPTRAEDMMIMSVSNSEIALTLDPKAIDVDDPEADERALFMQTKRYVLYIIRIQSGPTLLDILVQPVSHEDEHKWREIVSDEHSARRDGSDAVYSESFQQDLSYMSYPVLKRECLENIVRLEQLGWISRDNHYQELLNSIADDIRSQNRRRIERQRELQTTRGTLQNLTEKRRYLDSQLKSYNDYIEQAMLSLQSKKGKKKSFLPFTKQYYHMRDLQKAGQVPKFGSRKYSAAKLHEKGVLVSIVNESPPFDKFNIAISSDQIGIFTLSLSAQGGSSTSTTIQLDDLLQAQFNKAETIDVFDGQMKLRVSATLSLVFKHFFSQ